MRNSPRGREKYLSIGYIFFYPGFIYILVGFLAKYFDKFFRVVATEWARRGDNGIRKKNKKTEQFCRIF